MLLTSGGCLDRVRETDDEAADSVRLCQAMVFNDDETETHHVRLRLREGDDQLYDEEADLEPHEWLTVEAADVDPAEGAFTFEVRLNGAGWHEMDMTKIRSDPVAATALVTGDDSIVFLESSDGNIEC
ncbi:hypothetical protein C493_07349 [Natronolimnohabitans innermongolicus JCM 12255]|uniref:Ig-like domain-containing protein n=1 Tax=Natronolimnohabitans innermongolicus JCM 12255 TaxID=1227499 RepID=L9XAP7_9EURY|nr:hypothetical protein C493_07349 [Natronolimnohabitans innermongolicus JCM 12255]